MTAEKISRKYLLEQGHPGEVVKKMHDGNLVPIMYVADMTYIKKDQGSECVVLSDRLFLIKSNSSPGNFFKILISCLGEKSMQDNTAMLLSVCCAFKKELNLKQYNSLCYLRQES